MTLYGGNITNIFYPSQADLSLQNVYQPISITFTLDNTTAVLAWGGHIASRVDWGFFPNGEPRSAGGIHGSPYHMAIDDWYSPDAGVNKTLGNLGAQDRSLSAVAVFAPPVPFIALTKTPSESKVENGTLVTYTYNVTNTGGVDFTNVTITDDKFGLIAINQALAINTSKIFTKNVTLTTNTTNVAFALGNTTTGVTANATATATVTVIHPSISLTKTPDSSKVENGTSVTYTYNVTNTGDVALSAVNITDNVYGTIASGETLAVGQSKTFTKSATLTSNTTNTATASGIDQLGATVQAQATATVTVLHPNISITKTPSVSKIEIGTNVTYTYNVTNIGDTALSAVNVTDNIYGVIASGETLAKGQSKIFTKSVIINVTTTNTATAEGVDQLGAEVTAQASATVTVINPDISLTKTASASKVEVGTNVTYTYNVTNIGDTALSAVNVTDNTFGIIATGESLAVGEFKIFTKSVILNVTTTNIATAEGLDQLGTEVTAGATATVTVINPDISLTKTPSVAKVEVGTNVTYTYNVTNTGDTALFAVNITDNVNGVIASGESLAVGESKIFTKSIIVNATTTNTATATGKDQLGATVSAQAAATVTVIHPDINLTKEANPSKVEVGTNVTYTYNTTNTGDTSLTVSLVDDTFGTIFTGKVMAPSEINITIITKIINETTTNTATATGVDQEGAEVSDEASATVTVIHPDISLTKTPSASKVEVGSNVTYTYNVTNTGDTALSAVNITDDNFGVIASGESLAVGESKVFTKSVIINITTTNTATARGKDQLGATVTAEASATVTVLHPDISLTKTPSAAKVETGTNVTYTYNVTNIGDVALSAVNVTDNVYGSITTGDNLAVGQSKIFTKSAILTTNTTNKATATGVDQTGASVQANATASVRVLHPAISLTKTPSASKVDSLDTSAPVTYTYNTTNTGDTSLTVDLEDDTFGTIFTGLILAPSESNITTIVKFLTQNTTNTATATGVDQLETSVNATATATVTVIHPNISLTKTPSASKVVTGTNVTYTYNVTNTGDTALSAINITDNVYGVISSGETLAKGQSKIFAKSAILTTNTTNTATAYGKDQLGTTVQTQATASVTVLHPAINVTKDCSPEDQLAPGTITWTVVVKNTGDITLTAINITDTRHGVLDTAVTLNPGENDTIVIVETGLPPGTYYDNATAYGAYQLGKVSDWDDATCVVRPVLILKQFTNVTVLPAGISAGFSAVLVNSTQVNVYGLKSGPYIYFTVQYYFENSLNFLGDDFDGQAHNFTLWDKWGGNLLALGSPPVSFNPTKTGLNANRLKLADNSTFRIDPGLTGTDSYRGYIGTGKNISNLASQGLAWITLHQGDQQNGTNPGGGKGSKNDGKSYDTDIVWYIGELAVNQSATLTVYIAPGKNPGGQLQFSSLGCTIINTGPRVRAYGDSYANEDFLYAVERTNTLRVCVFNKR